MGLASCMNEIELKQVDYEKKIVVDGWIETDDYAQIYLTYSSPFLTNYDSLSISQTFLNHAKITLSSSDGESEILTLFRKETAFPPFVYKSKRMKGRTGLRYDLKVEYKGETLTSTTTIPASPTVKDLTMISVSDSSGNLVFSVQPSSTEKLKLFVQAKSWMAKENIHPSKVPLLQIPLGERSQTIHVERCRESNVYLSTRHDAYKHWNPYQYAKKDTILVKVGTVDMESYQVLKSLFADQAVRQNPFAFNSAGIQSNIIGGIGRWTGIGTAPTLIYIGKKP